MRRRKLLVGLGTLAVGSGLAVGTGAFTSVRANRSMTVETADDASALLKLTAPNSLENGEYARDSNEGPGDTLELEFDQNADVTGTGINADALSHFDDVFRVTNQGTDFVRLRIDTSGLSHPDRVQFYNGGNPNYEIPSSNYDGGINPGDSKTVGVELDTRGLDDPGPDWNSGTIVIEATDLGY